MERCIWVFGVAGVVVGRCMLLLFYKNVSAFCLSRMVSLVPDQRLPPPYLRQKISLRTDYPFTLNPLPMCPCPCPPPFAHIPGPYPPPRISFLHPSTPLPHPLTPTLPPPPHPRPPLRHRRVRRQRIPALTRAHAPALQITIPERVAVAVTRGRAVHGRHAEHDVPAVLQHAPADGVRQRAVQQPVTVADVGAERPAEEGGAGGGEPGLGGGG